MDEATMIYRKPVDDSDPLAIQDVGDRALEIKVVEGTDVPEYLGQGWVRHPSHIDHPPKPEEAAGLMPDRGKADAELKDLRQRVEALEADLKAATELADAESKAKDEALAKLAAIDQAKTLTVKM